MSEYRLNSFESSISFNGELLPEPTPIYCEGMFGVRSVEFVTPSMAHDDQDFLESLRDLLSKDNHPSLSVNKGSETLHGAPRCAGRKARLPSPQQNKSIAEHGQQGDKFPCMPFIPRTLSDNLPLEGDEQQRQFTRTFAQPTEGVKIVSDDNDTTDDDYDVQSSSSTASGYSSSCNELPTTFSGIKNRSCASSSAVFRSSQLEQWQQRYQEMSQFRLQFGHCLVPLKWPSNPSLAHWVSNVVSSEVLTLRFCRLWIYLLTHPRLRTNFSGETPTTSISDEARGKTFHSNSGSFRVVGKARFRLGLSCCDVGRTLARAQGISRTERALLHPKKISSESPTSRMGQGTLYKLSSNNLGV